MGVKVKTRPHGEIEVEEKQIIDFPEGILGFDYVKKFVILDSTEKSPFKWMQALSEPELAFIIIRPIDFLIQYELVISQSDLEAVQAETPEELLVFCIVTIPADNPGGMTANLQGPIIINSRKRIGKQAISLSEKYRVRHIILEEIKKASSSEE